MDVSDLVDDFDEEFFGGGGLERIARPSSNGRPPGTWSDLRGRGSAPRSLGPPDLVHRPQLRDHAAETGQAVPQEPILFTKSPNTLIGPNDDVRIPRGSTKPDWEVELGIVIGRRTSYLDSVDEALDSIAGYLVVNDVSERAFQMERGGQWSKGKSAETFNPAGPWLVTPDEVDDVLDLDMWLDVNGIRRQRQHQDDDLRPVLHRALPEPVPRSRARGSDQHRHPAWRRHGFHASGLASGW